MNVLIWKKYKELKRSQIWVVFFIVLAILLALTFVNFSGLQSKVIFWAYPISMCFITSTVLLNVDDFAQAILYEAIGIRMRSLWICNWALTSLLAFVTAESVMFIYGAILSWDIDISMVVNYLQSLPVIFALSALGTIHYKGNTRMEILVASIFSIISLGMLILPFILSMNSINNGTITTIAMLSIVGFLMSLVYLSLGRNENIIHNTDAFAKMYDDKFFGNE